MNVQTNVHHPDGAHKGLLYSVKYQLKSEPHTMLKGVDAEDHSAEKYFKTQFLSVSQALAFIDNDDVFHSDKMAFKVFPGWNVGNVGNTQMQGLWRRYLLRLTHMGELRSIEGFKRPIVLSALHLSFLFAPATKFMRYFHEDKLVDKEADAWKRRIYRFDGANDPHELLGVDRKKEWDVIDLNQRPTTVTRNNYDTVQDDYLNPHYDPVLSELPPGERFFLYDGTSNQVMTNNVWKRCKNRN